MFRRVTEITPDNVRGFYSLGAVYHEMGDLARAETAYKESIALKPNSAALSNLGTLYYDRARYRESAETFEKAVALAPSDSVLWTNLGDAYRWAPGLRARAATAYRKSIDLARAELAINPKDAAACVTLALDFAKTGNAAEAKLQIERAIAIDPKDVNTFYEAAIVASAGGDSAAAIDWVRRAAEAGYSRDRIEREPEFSGLKNHPDFQKALAAKSPPAR
jgi:Tfp pilus assembly protein PilF